MVLHHLLRERLGVRIRLLRERKLARLDLEHVADRDLAKPPAGRCRSVGFRTDHTMAARAAAWLRRYEAPCRPSHRANFHRESHPATPRKMRGDPWAPVCVPAVDRAGGPSVRRYATHLFCRRSLGNPWMERVLPVVEAISERCPERTVFTRFITPQRAEDMPGTWRSYYNAWPQTTRDHLDVRLLELMTTLRRLSPPAIAIDKTRYSAFLGPALLQHLRAREADTLIVTGSETDVWV